MRRSRFVGIIDLGVAAVVLVMLVLPAREMYARSAHTDTGAELFALALAEAKTMAHPEDGAAIDELSRRLGAEGEKDWAIEIAVRGSERAARSPTRWRALLAASVAFASRLDMAPALDYANRALSACEADPPACPSWQQLRMKQYQEQLDAGVKLDIDPRRGPDAARAFRRAAESALRQIRLGGHDGDRGGTAPVPTPSRTDGASGHAP